jgi:hypothetical protein
MNMESLLCTYTYLKSGPSNTHPTISHFFTYEPFHLSYNVIREVEGFVCRKNKASLDEH